MGPEKAAVVRSRGVAAKQGFLMCYTKGVAIGTEVSVRYKESGRFSGVVVKRGSTVILSLNKETCIILHKDSTIVSNIVISKHIASQQCIAFILLNTHTQNPF